MGLCNILKEKTIYTSRKSPISSVVERQAFNLVVMGSIPILDTLGCPSGLRGRS